MALKVGDKIPEFQLDAHLGVTVSSADLLGKTTVLAFFPLAWTPI